MKVLRFLNSIRADCGKTGTGLTTVKLKFDPMSGTGIDSHNESLLKLGKDSTATGVGIGIYGSDGKLLNLSANETIDAPLNSGGKKQKDATPDNSGRKWIFHDELTPHGAGYIHTPPM